jgi:hypothetical protein
MAVCLLTDATSLNELTVSPRVTNLAAYALGNMSALTNRVLEAGVVTSGDVALSYCTKAENRQLPRP